MSGIKSEVAQRFGLRDLGEVLSGSATHPQQAAFVASAPQQAAEPLASAYKTIARVVASQLQKLNGEANAFALLDALGMRIEELLPALTWMEQQKYVAIGERARNGDWKVRLLDDGKALL
jgi:hypothetical protein